MRGRQFANSCSKQHTPIYSVQHYVKGKCKLQVNWVVSWHQYGNIVNAEFLFPNHVFGLIPSLIACSVVFCTHFVYSQILCQTVLQLASDGQFVNSPSTAGFPCHWCRTTSRSVFILSLRFWFNRHYPLTRLRNFIVDVYDCCFPFYNHHPSCFAASSLVEIYNNLVYYQYFLYYVYGGYLCQWSGQF